MSIVKATICKVSRMPTKPLSMEPYLEILREKLREKVTGRKDASVRKYIKNKLKKLTVNDGQDTQTRKERKHKGNGTNGIAS